MSAITAKASRKMKKYAVLTREPRCFLGSFDFSWEQRKLGDIADIVGGGTPSTGNQSYWDGDIDWYAPAEIADQIYANSSQKKITGLGYENSSAKMLPPGTVLFTSRAGIGKTAILTRKGCTNQGFQSIVPHRGELDSYFIFSRTEELKRYGELVGAGSTFVEVSGKQMAVMELMMPPTMREQQTIGGFFQQLDHLITPHQRKCALLFSPFQAFISMMFITSTFSWEQRKLASLCEKFTDGDWIESKDQSDFGVRLVQTGNVGVAEYLDKPNNKKWISEDTFDRLHCEEVLPGDILISRLPEPAGRACIVPLLGTKMITAVDCTIVRTAPDMSNKFLVQYLSSQAYFDDVNTCLAGGTRQRISRGNLANFNVPIPVKKSEQDAIGMFFGYLDNLITLHQRKCIFFTGRAGRLISTVNKKRITSSWEQRKFDEVFDCTVPNNTLSRAELSYDEGTVLNVHYGDVLIKYGSVLDVQKDDIPRIPHRCREDFNGALLQDGDVIIADTAEDETTGKACEIGNLQGSAIVSGLHTMVCRPRNRMALGYLGYYLNSNAYHHQLLPLMQGIKVLSLSRSNIQKTSVSYPIAVKEQQLIAYYFSQLDNLITLHQRKPFLMKWRTSDANRNQTNRLVL